MGIQETLFELEKRGAEALVSGGAADFYRELLTEDALMMVPGFVADKATFLAGASGGPGWKSFRIEAPRAVQLTPDCAVLQYRTTGARDGQPDYIALMSSTYVKRDGAWRLAFHQQTPMPST